VAVRILGFWWVSYTGVPVRVYSGETEGRTPMPKYAPRPDFRIGQSLGSDRDGTESTYPQGVFLEGYCNCEREACVGHDVKVYVYFPKTVSKWVLAKGLYHKCYDEVVKCPRCGNNHKRGHIGRAGRCAKPYTDQGKHIDC
jgi:hypothetical protein